MSPTAIQIPTLRTRRLILEPLGPSHSAGMFRLWSDEAVCRYSGPVRDFAGELVPLPARTAADSDRIIDFFVRHALAGRGLRWAMLTRDERRFAGAVGFNGLGACPELAYHLAPALWGRGLMQEAATAALRWLVTERRADQAEAFIEPANLASINLADRLGFAKTGERDGTAERYVVRLG